MTTELKAGIPASALDVEVFYDGVLMDPFAITYAMKDPDGTTTTIDEDGKAVSGRDPLIGGTGRFNAGNTVIPKTAESGTYKIIWTITKFSASVPITREEEFTFAGAVVEDGSREEVTRRDIPDETEVWKLRVKIGDVKPDDTEWAWFNSELKAILEESIAKHTKGARNLSTATDDDKAMSMTLAHATVMYRLATDKVKFFKWKDGNEEVDKSMQPRNCAVIADQLLKEYNAHSDRRLKEKQSFGSADAPAGDLLVLRGARRGRRRRR